LDFDIYHLHHTSICERTLSWHNSRLLLEIWEIQDDKEALIKRCQKRLIGDINKFGSLDLVEINKEKL
jgi:hypothetical protein